MSSNAKIEISVLKSLNNRNFNALLVGQSLSRFGDVIFNTILPLLVYNITNSLNYTGIVLAASILPQIFLLPFTGVVVDKIPRKFIMCFTDCGRIIVLAYLISMSQFSTLKINSLIIGIILFGVMDSFFKPAYAALRAEVHVQEIRNSANSLTQIVFQTINLVGPAFGGLLYSYMSISFVFLIDLATFIISFISLLSIKSEEKYSGKLNNTWSMQMILEEYRSGLSIIIKTKWIYLTIIAFSIANIAYSGIYKVLLPWFVEDFLSLQSTYYGVLISFSGIGGLLAALIFGMKKRWEKRGIWAYLGIFMTGLSLFNFSYLHNFGMLCFLSALSGAGIMLFGLIWETSLQELVPSQDYGKVSSLDMLGSFTLMPLGYILTSKLAESTSGIIALSLEGAVLALLALSMLSIRAIRTFE